MNRSHRKFVPVITAVAAVLVLPMTSFSTPAAAPTGQLSSVLDHLVAPVREGRISSRYGVNVLPIGPGKGGERFHRGIDIASAKDTPIYAVSDGRVKVAVEDFQNSDKPAYGKYVQIEHSAGIQSVYSHLNTLLVKPGQTVSAGQQIGNVGNTGRATGPHLHMELYVDGIAVDPEQYIEFAL